MIFNFLQVFESRILTRPEPVSVAEGGYTASDVIHSIDLTEPQGKIKNNENLQRVAQ